MKYLVVHASEAGEEKTLCADEKEAVELVESKLRDGCADADFQVYTAEPVSFNVDRVPVVTLGAETAGIKDVSGGESQPDATDFPSASYSSYTSDDKNDDKSEDINPFSTEQVFSLDS